MPNSQTATEPTSAKASPTVSGDDALKKLDEMFGGTPSSNEDDIQPEQSPTQENEPTANTDSGTPEDGGEEEDSNPADNEDGNAVEEDGEEEGAGKRPKLSPEAQKIFDKHIGKERAKRKKLETELTEAQNRIAALEAETERAKEEAEQNAAVSSVGLRRQSGPFDQIHTQEALDNYVDFQLQIIDAIENGRGEEGYEFSLQDSNGQTHSFSLSLEEGRSEIRRIRRLVEVDARRHERFLALKQKAESELAKVLPETIVPSSETSRSIRATLAKYPSLKSLPDGKRIAFYLSLGQTLFNTHGAASMKIAKTPAHKVAPQKATQGVPPKTISKKEPAPVAHGQEARKVLSEISREEAQDMIANRLGYQS